MTIEFDSWLESELDVEYATFATAQIPAGAPYRNPHLTPAGHWSPARFAARSVPILAAAALGLVATGALAAAAVTGSADPQVWTEHIGVAIATCTGVGTGAPAGIGSCVNAIVHHAGPQLNSQGSPGPAAGSQSGPPPAPEAKSGGPGPKVDRSAPADTPAASDAKVPHGRPTDLPAGPPVDMPHGQPASVPGAAHKAQGKPAAPPGSPPATPPAKGH